MDQEVLGSELPRESIRCCQPSTWCTDRHPRDHCSARTCAPRGSWTQSKHRGRNQGGRQDTDFRTQIIIDTTERGRPSVAGTSERDVNTHGGFGEGARFLLCQGMTHPIPLLRAYANESSCGISRSWYNRNLNLQRKEKPQTYSKRFKRSFIRQRFVPITRLIVC
jgi:hypothetical protein